METATALNEYLVVNQNIEPVIESGQGAEIVDANGKTYVDLEAGPGVASVGHCHPSIVAAIKRQADRLLQVPGRYHSMLTLNLAKRLSELTAGRLRRTFFANSGAEANDGAIKCSLKHAVKTGKQGFGILAFEHGFHGRLSLTSALTGIAKQKKGMATYATFPGIVHVPAPYCYRCPLGLKPDSCGTRCAEAIVDAIKTRVPGEAAVMIAEPILGVGGVITPPDDYWPKVQEICDSHRITLIHDEVFVGFGRTGKWFAHEWYGTRPDIVTFAKTIGGGVPLGGFMATETLGTAFEPPDHFTTYGAKNQIGIAAAHAVLDVIAGEGLLERATVAGRRFMTRLDELRRKFPILGDVRGKGLMIGLEIVHPQDRAPAAEAAKKLEQRIVQHGALISTTGVNGNILRITPPLVITDPQIDRACDAVEAALAEVSAQ
jgi:4-aminobutyrate aminotransferase / (S)-3-amino-2-methylpropionate transaminase / 5-aminovalerate transaminase